MYTPPTYQHRMVWRWNESRIERQKVTCEDSQPVENRVVARIMELNVESQELRWFSVATNNKLLPPAAYVTMDMVKEWNASPPWHPHVSRDGFINAVITRIEPVIRGTHQGKSEAIQYRDWSVITNVHVDWAPTRARWSTVVAPGADMGSIAYVRATTPRQNWCHGKGWQALSTERLLLYVDSWAGAGSSTVNKAFMSASHHDTSVPPFHWSQMTVSTCHGRCPLCCVSQQHSWVLVHYNLYWGGYGLLLLHKYWRWWWSYCEGDNENDNNANEVRNKNIVIIINNRFHPQSFSRERWTQNRDRMSLLNTPSGALMEEINHQDCSSIISKGLHIVVRTIAPCRNVRKLVPSRCEEYAK